MSHHQLIASIQNKLKQVDLHALLADSVDGEIIVDLASGWSLRSGSEQHISGEYVRLVDPAGREIFYWHHDEWETDPILVMGAIINAAAVTSKVRAFV